MNWLLIGLGIVFLIGAIVGYVRGMIKIAVSLVATIATLLLVVAITPYVSKLVYKLTLMDDIIIQQCEQMMMPKMGEVDLTGTPLEGMKDFDLKASGITEEEIKEALSSIEIPKQTQIDAIEKADIPVIFKELLLTNNNTEVYKSLGVKSFPQYVGAYMAKVIIGMLSFLVTFLLVTIVVRAVIFALDIIADLPVINGLNRLGGALLGLSSGVIIAWIAFIILTLLYTTAVGKMGFAMIEESSFLRFLYDHNIIMSWVTKM